MKTPWIHKSRNIYWVWSKREEGTKFVFIFSFKTINVIFPLQNNTASPQDIIRMKGKIIIHNPMTRRVLWLHFSSLCLHLKENVWVCWVPDGNVEGGSEWCFREAMTELTHLLIWLSHHKRDLNSKTTPWSWVEVSKSLYATLDINQVGLPPTWSPESSLSSGHFSFLSFFASAWASQVAHW